MPNISTLNLANEQLNEQQQQQPWNNKNNIIYVSTLLYGNNRTKMHTDTRRT